MINRTNLLGKDNPSWPTSNALETKTVPASIATRGTALTADDSLHRDDIMDRPISSPCQQSEDSPPERTEPTRSGWPYASHAANETG